MIGRLSLFLFEFISILAFVGVVSTCVRKIKKGRHAEALEACGQRPIRHALPLMHSSRSPAHMLRVPQHDVPSPLLELSPTNLMLA